MAVLNKIYTRTGDAGETALGIHVNLMIDINGFAKGGDFNRKNTNRIMRYRITAQAVAVVYAETPEAGRAGAAAVVVEIEATEPIRTLGEALAQKQAALKAIRDEVAAWPRTGEVADKAFFDSLNDE